MKLKNITSNGSYKNEGFEEEENNGEEDDKNTQGE